MLTAAAVGCAPPPLVPTAPAPAVEPAEIEHTVFLIGDAGVPALPSDPVLAALTARARVAPTRTTIVFMGDNVYPRGMPLAGDPGRPGAERRLRALMDAVPDGAQGIFLMGNHDWVRGRDGGWDAVRRQEAFVEGAGRAGLIALPDDGCPGPVVEDVSPHLRLILIDTQWWLQSGDRPEHPTSGCPADSVAEVTAALRAATAGGNGRHVLVVGHHPIRSGGVHGGHFDWKDHIFPLRAWQPWLWIPLPLIGSLYPLIRGSGVSNQDLSSARYGELADSLRAAFADRVVAYAGGHEHNLQVLDAGATQLLVSGSGAYGHVGKAFRLPTTRYARAGGGFMRLDVLTGGRLRLGVIVADATGSREDFSMWLPGASP